jgi:hypothetical protein
MPPELRAQFTDLPEAAREGVLRAMIRFHGVIEEETFELVRAPMRAGAAED